MTGMMLLMLPAMGSTLDFTPRIVTMRSFFAQQNHLGVSNYVIDCLNSMNI